MLKAPTAIFFASARSKTAFIETNILYILLSSGLRRDIRGFTVSYGSILGFALVNILLFVTEALFFYVTDG